MARALATLFLWGLFAPALADIAIPVVAYHDIVPTRTADPYAITIDEFDQQLAYIQRNGYQPISLAALHAARSGVASLPAKPILLTFDDGLQSFYRYARPRLERHGYPALVSVVTRWVDAGRITTDDHRGSVMTWDELRALGRTPLVEIISHSDDLHRGIIADAYGTRVSAATARTFGVAGDWESEDTRRERVTRDLARSAARLRTELGVAPRAVAWPYGEYDATLVAAARAAGMMYHLTLDDAPTTWSALPQINRFTFYRYQGLSDFARALAFNGHRRWDMRFIEIDFAVFDGAAPAAREAMIGSMLERLRLLRVNAVVLHPFDTNRARSFFATNAMPMQDDIALHLATAILRRTAVKRIYWRLPETSESITIALANDLAQRHPVHGILVGRNIGAQTARRMRGDVERYRPQARVYTAAIVADEAGWVQVQADESPAVLRKLARGHDSAATLYVVRAENSDAATLRAAMAALREGGARHFGYGPDALLANQPDARVVIAPLHAHTIGMRRP